LTPLLISGAVLACTVLREQAIMRNARKLYESPNGDRWYLVRDSTGAVFVRHEANVASGGHIEHIEVGAFLTSGQGPEQQELMRLIGSLLEEHSRT
jgi:hypothetical protein